MIIAIDVGNTNIVIGGIRNGRQLFSARLSSDRQKTSEEYALSIGGILQMHGIDPSEIEGGILSSVVPYLRSVIPAAVRLLTGIDLLVVNSDMNTGMNIRMDDPSTVGSDLIVSAVAARDKYPAPLAIIDMGTATTLVVVDGNGDYIGGLIISGLWVSLNSLSSQAAQLPHIDLNAPTKLLGKNTVDCMRAGALIGSSAMLDGLVDRVEEELGKPVTVVLTGGVAPLILPYCKRKMHLEPDLLIHGLWVLYEKNRK